MVANGRKILSKQEFSLSCSTSKANTSLLKIAGLILRKASHVQLVYNCSECSEFLIFLLWKRLLQGIILQ